jgi:hypothetical protein
MRHPNSLFARTKCAKISVAVAAALLFCCTREAAAESAGELGRHYGVRYTMPIIIGPLRDIRQGKLPPPAILDRPETPDTEDGEVSLEDEAFSSFNPDFDFDEPLYADYAADSLADLYAVLHKRGSRVSAQISPLMRFTLEEVKQRTRPQAKKQAKKAGRTAAENKKRPATR